MKLLLSLVTIFSLEASASNFSRLKWCRVDDGGGILKIEQKVDSVDVTLSSISAETTFDFGKEEVIADATGIDTLHLQTTDFEKAVGVVTASDQVLRFLRLSDIDEINEMIVKIKQQCK